MTDATTSGAGWFDPSIVRRTRRRRAWLVTAVGAVGLLVVVGTLAVVGGGYDDLARQERAQVQRDRASLVGEHRAWTLPASLVAVPRLDEDFSGLPFADVERHFAAVAGATTDQAVDDLIRYLSTRGWVFGADPHHPWSAEHARLHAMLTITVEAGIIRLDMTMD